MAAHEEAGLPSPSGEVHEHFSPPPTRIFGDGTLPPRRSTRGEPMRSYGRNAPRCARLRSTAVRSHDRRALGRPTRGRRGPHKGAEPWAYRNLRSSGEWNATTAGEVPIASAPQRQNGRRATKRPRMTAERRSGCYMRIPTLWMAAVTVKSEHCSYTTAVARHSHACEVAHQTRRGRRRALCAAAAAATESARRGRPAPVGRSPPGGTRGRPWHGNGPCCRWHPLPRCRSGRSRWTSCALPRLGSPLFVRHVNGPRPRWSRRWLTSSPTTLRSLLQNLQQYSM